MTAEKAYTSINSNFPVYSYPFGMVMPERNWTSSSAQNYRYAYNGMEQDAETSGNGNSYTTEFRQYDPRLGRWKSLDPLMAQFPWQSPYCAFDNNPIYYVDPYGLSAVNGTGGGSGGGTGTDEPPKSSLLDRLFDKILGRKVQDVDEVEFVYTRTWKDKLRKFYKQSLSAIESGWNSFAGIFENKRKEPITWQIDSNFGLENLNFRVMIPGDKVRVYLHDYGGNYENGITRDYKEYIYLGNGRLALKQDYWKRKMQLAAADWAVELAMWAVPTGRVLKILGKAYKWYRGTKSASQLAIYLAERGVTKGATAELIMPNGKIFVGTSSGIKNFKLTDEMTGILSDVARTNGKVMPSWFGGCAEMNVIQQARSAGHSWAEIRSATLNAYEVGGIPGSPKPYCVGCQGVLDILPDL